MKRDEVIREIKEVIAKGYLYKSPVVNYKGKVSGEEEKWQD